MIERLLMTAALLAIAVAAGWTMLRSLSDAQNEIDLPQKTRRRKR